MHAYIIRNRDGRFVSKLIVNSNGEASVGTTVWASPITRHQAAFILTQAHQHGKVERA